MSAADMPVWKTVVAGGGAGVVEICAMYSTDVCKTRQQLSKEPLSMLQCYRTIIREQGWLGLYRGVSTPILAEAPKRAWKFTANQEFKRYVAAASPGGKLTVAGSALAGAMAGVTESFINAPFETIKVRLQSRENLARFNSSTECLVALVKEEGVLALYNGIEPMALRNLFWNGIYFGTIGLAQIQFPLRKGASKSEQLSYKFASGTAGSMLGTLANTPFDVVKTRMQQQARVTDGSPLKYRNAFQSLSLISAEEGVGALYKGLGARLARLGPGGGLMVVTFDFICGLLK